MAFVRYDLSNTCGGEEYNTHNNENTSTPWQQQRLVKHSRGNGLSLPWGGAEQLGEHKASLLLWTSWPGLRQHSRGNGLSLPWGGAEQLAPTLIPYGRHPGPSFQCHPPLESWRRRWSHPPGRSGDGF